ncbi:MAG: transpeptidase family protein [Alistipes sp.]|nr:transpeptidase family protein [Alistipes sp.]
MARQKPEIDVRAEMFSRAKTVHGLFLVTALLVVVRLIWVLWFSGEVAYNADRLEERIFVADSVYSRRGSIMARNGEPLATSILRYRVDFDMGSDGFDSLKTFAEQADTLGKLLANFFGDRSAADYRREMIKAHNKHYRVIYRKDTTVLRSEGFFARVWDMLRKDEYKTVKLYDTIRDHHPVAILPRAVDYNEWQELRKYPILNWNLGMTYNLVTLDQRVYPYGDLGRRTLGLVGDRGNYGIEAFYRTTLEGKNGRQVRQRIAPGFSTLVHSPENIDAEDGLDIVTTLDVDIQHCADAALRRQLETQKGIWGTSMVMEVATGDILAMVNLGETSERSGTYIEKENYALSRRMEPGSTFKLAALLALVEDCGMPITQRYDTFEGRAVRIGGPKGPLIQDSHNIGKDIDLKEATAQSSNVYFAEAIYQHYKDNPERYVKFLGTLGLDKVVGLDQMGTAAPLYERNVKKWSTHTLPNMGYGYAIEIPPIQTLTLYNAIANRGRMVAPRLISEVRRGDNVVDRFPTRVINERICSDETLLVVRECLEETARTGTAKQYFRDTLSFRVAGKTGTAKFAQSGIKYSDGYYLGTMVVYFPADNPKYTVMTSIFTHRSRGATYYGAGLAGPVQRDIVNYIYYRDEDWHQNLTPSKKEKYPTDVKGGNIARIRRVADKYSPRVSFTDREGWGVASTDTLLNVDIKSITDSKTMPNVVGMGLRDALYLLESRGLKVHFTGKGTVRSQSIPAGRSISEGHMVSLTLK